MPPLPLLVGHFARQSGSVGAALGLLYFVNTLGAGAACLIAATLMFPFLGMQGAIYVAVALNATVAAGAVAAHVFRSAAAYSGLPEPTVTRPPLLRLEAAVAMAFFGGFVSLSYEIFFFRITGYANGSSAPTFAVTLGAFLVGLAGGSRDAGRVCGTAPEKAASRLLRDVTAAILVGSLFLPLLRNLAWLGSAVLGIALFLVYLFARHWGSLLPCIAEFGVSPNRRAGMHTGIIYLANILGSAAGAIVTGFVLMDRLSHIGIAQSLAAIASGGALVLIVLLPLPGRSKLMRAVAVLAIAGCAVLFLPIAAAEVLENMLWRSRAEAKTPFAAIVENRSGIITVDDPARYLATGL